MLFINEDENGKLYKYFFKNVWYEVYNTNDALIIKMADSSNDSETEVVKMICKLRQIKAKEGDWGLLPNSDMAKQKFKELRKLIQKKGKFKKSGKMIQFIEENNDAKTKLIEKLKKEACRVIKEIIAIKGTDREDELSDDDDLKDNKLGFTKSAVSIWSSLCIQA